MAMETSSSNTVFPAEKVDAATAPVKEEGPSAGCKGYLDLFRWLFSCGACSSDPSKGKGYLNTVSYKR